MQSSSQPGSLPPSRSESTQAARPLATFEDDLQQLDNALLPLKADLPNSCVTYANHIEALANFSVDSMITISGAEAAGPAGPGQARSESATVAVTDRGPQDAVLRCRRFRRRPVQPPAAVRSGRPGLGPGADPVCHIVTNRSPVIAQNFPARIMIFSLEMAAY
jgi:hypothetical protein